MATNVVQEASEALAESREQPTSTTLHHAKYHEGDGNGESSRERVAILKLY